MNLNDFQALPDEVLPINEWNPEGKGWHNVEEGIRRVVNKMQPGTSSSSGTSEIVLLSELLFQHGNALMMLGQLDMAIDAYSDTIAHNQRDARVYYNRGTAYFRQGDFDDAIADYTEAINRAPNHTDAYYYRGTAYLRQGDIDDAITDYTKVINLKPDHTFAYEKRDFARNAILNLHKREQRPRRKKRWLEKAVGVYNTRIN